MLAGKYPGDADSRLVSPVVTLPAVTGRQRVELRFWHWFDYENGDGGDVQISVAGSPWQTLGRRAPTGVSPGWSLAKVDLTDYAGQSVRIAFFHQAVPFYEASGWYVDEVELWRGVPSVTWPEGFESGWGDWSADGGLWQVGPPTSGPSAAYAGANVVGTMLGGDYPEDTDSRLISPAIDLSAVTGDQRLELRFQQWYRYASGDHGHIQVSRLSGGAWTEWESIAETAPTGVSAGWGEARVDLTAFAGGCVPILRTKC